MTLAAFLDQTLSTASRSLTLAQSIRTAVSGYLWRPARRFTTRPTL